MDKLWLTRIFGGNKPETIYYNVYHLSSGFGTDGKIVGEYQGELPVPHEDAWSWYSYYSPAVGISNDGNKFIVHYTQWGRIGLFKRDEVKQYVHPCVYSNQSWVAQNRIYMSGNKNVKTSIAY